MAKVLLCRDTTQRGVLVYGMSEAPNTEDTMLKCSLDSLRPQKGI